MKKLKILIIFLSLLFYAAISPAVEDSIIAVVNNEVITLQDLKEYIHSNYVAMITEGWNEKQIREAMANLEINGINNLIEDKLMLSEANNIGLTILAKTIDQRMNEIQNRYPSDEEFLTALVQNGATITDLRNKIEDKLKIQYLIESQVKSKIYIKPQEVTDFYQNNIENFRKNEKVDLESIYIPFEGNKNQSKEKIEQALKLINEGKNFEDVAKEYSSSPNIGIIEKGMVLPQIETAVFNLNEGMHSSVIEIDSGFYIFKIKKKFPSQTATLQETKKFINDLLFKEKFKNEFEKWIEKLKSKAYVEIKK